MTIYDVSMAIQPGMAVYKNKEEKRPLLKQTTRGHVTETLLTMNLHTGTHIDAPLHMVPEGEDMAVYRLDQFMGKALVVPVPEDVDVLTGEIIQEVMAGLNTPVELTGFDGLFVLFKTRNSFVDGFDPNFVYLAADGAEFLRAGGAKGVGIDALGIERGQADHPAHRILLQGYIPVLEGLRLKEVPPGLYTLIALPLSIEEVEAAPVRAILLEGSCDFLEG